MNGLLNEEVQNGAIYVIISTVLNIQLYIPDGHIIDRVQVREDPKAQHRRKVGGKK